MGKSEIRRFEDLRVWRDARELVRGVYRATRTRRLRDDWGLVNQMRRAAVSITSNIAEGHERGSRVQYIEFCFYAKGSTGELRSQVINAHDVELIDDDVYDWLHDKCEAVSRQLASYIKHLIETAKTYPGMKFTREADRNKITFDEFLAEYGTERLQDGRHIPIENKE